MTTLPTTVGALTKRGMSPPVPVRQEVRKNLFAQLLRNEPPFANFPMFTHTVVPALARALLAEHTVILLGLRGQGKSTLLRAVASLLDPWAPRLVGTPLPEHPLAPISPLGRELAANPASEVVWVSPQQRLLEYVAVPDLTVADMFGEPDPFRAQRLGTDMSDPAALSFGIAGEANHGIFVLNELPDLAPKVQVALFDLLQEGTVQPAGTGARFPLDTLVLFTANPEDYTQRGRIVTPLRDRIGSEIHTHYATDWRVAAELTNNRANVPPALLERIPPVQREYIEQLAFVARASQFAEPRSGVSQRLPIAALELLGTEMQLREAGGFSGADIVVPYAHFSLLDPAITGRIELTFEGEELGSAAVAARIRQETFLAVAASYIPEADLAEVVKYFDAGGSVSLHLEMNEHERHEALRHIPGLLTQAGRLPLRHESDVLSNAEFILEALVAVGSLAREQTRYHAVTSPQPPEPGEQYALN